MAEAAAVIGKTIKVKGEVTGAGNLVVEGELEGRVELDHLVIEPTGNVIANIEVDHLTVHGKASGNIEASRKVEVKASATVFGDVRAPSVVIEEGAVFKGRVQMDVGIDEGV